MISSLQNSKIKNIVKLQEKASERRKQNLIVVEGKIEITLLFKASFEISELYICPSLVNQSFLEQLKAIISNFPIVEEITEQVYQKIAYREKSTGIIALAKPKYTNMEELTLPKNPLIVVLEAVEKPGNLGAILRTADAANVDAVMVCDPHTDIYNPNAIRSSIGCVFTKPIITCTNEQGAAFLKKNGMNVYATALIASKPYTEIDFTAPTALVMGTEATGLSDFWLDASTQNIIIPMQGEIDSMNVSVATAVVVFEAVRQRKSSF